jgi:hypothetical protein
MAWAARLAGRDPSARGSIAATLKDHGLLQNAASPRERQNPGRRNVEACRSARGSALAIVQDLSDALREAFEERAAIMEFEGGLPRAQAEEEALASILRH